MSQVEDFLVQIEFCLQYTAIIDKKYQSLGWLCTIFSLSSMIRWIIFEYSCSLIKICNVLTCLWFIENEIDSSVFYKQSLIFMQSGQFGFSGLREKVSSKNGFVFIFNRFGSCILGARSREWDLRNVGFMRWVKTHLVKGVVRVCYFNLVWCNQCLVYSVRFYFTSILTNTWSSS